jgi:hypothetical protein
VLTNRSTDPATTAAIGRVMAAGSDLSVPMVVDFFVAVPNAVAGRAVSAAARRAGFEVSLRSDEGRTLWACVCTRVMVASPAAVGAVEHELDRLASPFGGRAQGWGTYGNVAERRASARAIVPGQSSWWRVQPTAVARR